MKTKKDAFEPNIHNEQVLLASAMKSRKSRVAILEKVSYRDFLAKRHKTICRILAKMEESDLEFSEDTMVQMAGEQDIGGFEYIRDVLKAYAANVNLSFHLEILITDRIKYQLFNGPLTEIEDAIRSKDVKGPELLVLSEKISTIISSAVKTEKVKGGDSLAQEYLTDLEARASRVFIGTGIVEIDEALVDGFSPETISVIAGRPASGKTTLVANIITSIIRSHKILVCPIETGNLSLLDLLMSNYTGIPISKIVKESGELDDREKRRLQNRARTTLRNPNLSFLDDPDLTLDRIEAELKKMKYELCFIDLFTRLSDINSRTEIISEKLKQCKRIARKTGTHLCLVHQIRRRRSDEKSNRPSLERLKDSGTWEEVGDLIFGCHREKIFNPSTPKDILEVSIMKQKRGAAGTVLAFAFDGSIGEVGEFISEFAAGRDNSEF